MAIINTRKLDIKTFFEFASGNDDFYLVDIQNDSEQKELDYETAKGSFVYETKFFVNQKMCDEKGIEGFRFSFFSDDPTKVFKQEAFQEFVIQNDSKNFVYNNITNDLDSSVVKNQKENIHEVIISGEKSNFGKKIIIPVSAKLKTTNFRHTSTVAKTSKKDPANLLNQKNYSLGSSLNAITLDHDNTTSLTDDENYSESSNRRNSSLTKTKNSIRNRPRAENILTKSLETAREASSKVSNVKSFLFRPIKTITTHRFGLEKSKVQSLDKFYVEISVVSEKQQNVKKISSIVYHKKDLNDYLSVPEPPSVKIISTKIGSSNFLVTKEDPTLYKVKVQRIIYNFETKKSKSDDLGTISFQKSEKHGNENFGDKNVIFKDQSVNNIHPNVVFYRFSVLDDQGSIGPFTGITIPSFDKIHSKSYVTDNSVSIICLNKTDGINITVNILTDQIIAFRLLREEIGKSGNHSDKIVCIKNDLEKNTTDVGNKLEKYTFVDRTSVLGKKYRYFIASYQGYPGHVSCSQEILSTEDETIVRRFPYMNIPFSIDVKNQKVSFDSSNSIEVSFDIEINQTQELYNTVFESLKTAGVGEEIISQLQQDETKIKQFVTFLVERFNVSTGKRTSLGFAPAGTFSDSNTLRKVLKVDNIESGNEYVYIIKACLQQPSVFLQSTSSSIINRSGVSYQKNAARFSRSLYDRLGVMPSENDVKNGKSIESLLLETQIGIEKSIEIKTPMGQTKFSLKSITKKMKYNKISWGVTNSKNISYFQVFSILNGHENLLGAVACPNNSSSFSYKDTRNVNEVGDLSYRVQAIDYDDHLLDSFELPVESNNCSIPENLMSGYVYDDVEGKEKCFFIEKFDDLKNFSKITDKSSNFLSKIEKDSNEFWKRIDLPNRR